MVQATFGGKGPNRTQVRFESSDEFLVVRTRNRNALERASLTGQGRSVVDRLTPRTRFRDAGVEILQATQIDAGEARSVLKQEFDLQFAGRALADPQTGTPAAYTENIFLKLQEDLSSTSAVEVLMRLKYGLKVKRRLDFARHAYFLEAPEDTGQAVFDMANELLDMPEVELCHPEIVRERAKRGAFPQQWHLGDTEIGGQNIRQSANVTPAWAVTEGEGIVIAVIDDGVDLDHPEFTIPGKIVNPFDATRNLPDARPYYAEDRHGTACAGVAAAAGVLGAAGVAPKAKLMPIRLVSGLGSIPESEAFYWALRHGADIISCSWGPPDGKWWDPTDPRHQLKVPLPDNTRLAIEAAANTGRAGRGCVVLFAAGNGNESVDNDGYASCEHVIAVAACNDQGMRSAYSDFGNAVWCAFPSSHGAPSLTPGIWTTDRAGPDGYNPGNSVLGDAQGYFTGTFGGTSSACPGAAGVAALVLAANPWLKRSEVRDILKDCCDKIDQNSGQYDPQGRSPLYGWGRLNADRAVQLARGLISPPGPVVGSQAGGSAPISQPQKKRVVKKSPSPTKKVAAKKGRLSKKRAAK